MTMPPHIGAGDDWLVVIDPQTIFAATDSPWAAPSFAAAMENIRDLAQAYRDRVLVTRWIPTADRSTSWGAYFEAWPFADESVDHPLFALVEEAQSLSVHDTIDLPTFGKWGPELESVVGRGARLTLTGVSTDCCVLSTALAAADGGAYVTVAADACAGSTPENQEAALHVLGLYPPQISVRDTASILRDLPRRKTR